MSTNYRRTLVAMIAPLDQLEAGTCRVVDASAGHAKTLSLALHQMTIALRRNVESELESEAAPNVRDAKPNNADDVEA